MDGQYTHLEVGHGLDRVDRVLGEVAGDNAGVLVDSPPLGAHRHVVPARLSATEKETVSLLHWTSLFRP